MSNEICTDIIIIIDEYSNNNNLGVITEPISIRYEKNNPIFFHMPIMTTRNDNGDVTGDYINYYIFSNKEDDEISDDEEIIEDDNLEEIIDERY